MDVFGQKKRADMLRSLLIGVAVACSLVAAPVCSADTPPGEQDVPNMQFNAVYGGPCLDIGRFRFGRAPNGQALACVTSDEGANWVLSAPLRGVQQIGDPCSGDGAAQSPDGLALICEYGQGWVLGE
jgi:hypothetical protein